MKPHPKNIGSVVVNVSDLLAGWVYECTVIRSNTCETPELPPLRLRDPDAQGGIGVGGS